MTVLEDLIKLASILNPPPGTQTQTLGAGLDTELGESPADMLLRQLTGQRPQETIFADPTGTSFSNIGTLEGPSRVLAGGRDIRPLEIDPAAEEAIMQRLRAFTPEFQAELPSRASPQQQLEFAQRRIQRGVEDIPRKTKEAQMLQALGITPGDKESTQDLRSQILSQTLGIPSLKKAGDFKTEFELRQAAATGDPTAIAVLQNLNKEKTAERQVQAEITASTRPIPQGAQTQIASLNSLSRSVQEIKNQFNKNFVGPVVGQDLDYASRRVFGKVIGRPLSEQEVQFRQNLDNIKDQLLRARSGAQINEQEYARLSTLLPKATDEPKVFQSGLKRFQDEINHLVTERKKLATMTTGELQQEIKEGSKTQPRLISPLVPK